MLKKWIIALLMIAIFANISYATPSNTIDGLFPDIDTLDIHSNQPKNFEKYPNTHYMFDTEKFGILDAWASGITAITNFIFLLNVFISYAVNYLLMSCYKFNLFKIITDMFNSLIWAVRDAVFIPLLTPLLAMAGISLLFSAVMSKFTTAWRITLNTIAVLIIAYAFFGNPAFFVEMVNEASEGISGEVLAKTASIATGTRLTADDAVINLGNTFWETTVVKPWQLIQFGDINTGEAEMDKYLQNSLSDPQRLALANDMGQAGNELFKPIGAVIRFAMVAFIGIVVLAINILVGILAVLTMMLQFAAVISAVIMVIAFLLALLPNMGTKVAIHGLLNTFGFLLGKIGLTILLSMYFSLNIALYRFSNVYGWFLVTLMQLILVATIILFRKKIMSFAYSVTGGQQRAIENIHNKPNLVKDAKRAAVTVYAAKKMHQDVSHMRELRNDRKLTKEYEPVSKEYLLHRYTNEKRTAESKAKTEGTEVEYSDFVKQTDSRIEKGFDFFDEREVNRTTEMMKGLHRQGNDPRNLLTTKIEGNSDRKINTKQLELEKQVEIEKGNLEDRQLSNANKINKNIRAEKESKLYDKNIVKQLNREEKNAEISQTFADHPEATIMNHGVDNIILGKRFTGALEELRNDKLERDYKEAKKFEYDSKDIVNAKEQEIKQEEKQVVNGQMSNFNRPVGRTISNDLKTREQRELVPENESFVKINNDMPMTSLEHREVNRENNHEKEEANHNNVIEHIEKKGINREVLNNNVVNNNDIRTETSKNVTDVIEREVNKSSNITNSENRRDTVIENKKNEQKTVENITENIINNNETRTEKSKNITEVLEKEVNKSNNITNSENRVDTVTENVRNENSVRENVTNNVINEINKRENTIKNTTNVEGEEVNRKNNIRNLHDKLDKVIDKKK